MKRLEIDELEMIQGGDLGDWLGAACAVGVGALFTVSTIASGGIAMVVGTGAALSVIAGCVGGGMYGVHKK